jgi:hypothetical protein
MKKVVILTESDLVRLVKRVIQEETGTPTITLDNPNEVLNKLIFDGMIYQVYFKNGLVGAIYMLGESASMAERNNWNYPTMINVDFSKAKPLKITQGIIDTAKKDGDNVNTNIQNRYEKIYFTKMTKEAGLFGDINEGKVKSDSLLIRCKIGDEMLFIYQSIDNNWYYVTLTK